MPDAKRFFYDFTAAVTDAYWDDYHNSDEWTGRVTEIIVDLIKSYGLRWQKEYFRIDISGWSGRWKEIEKEAKSVGLNPHLWDLKIAVEHENDPKDWTDELVKLAHIRCPLKVIIGYAPCDERDAGSEDRKLDFAANVLKKLDVFDPHTREELLLILGNAAPKHKDSPDYETYGYRGYIYDNTENRFRAIEE